MSFCIYLCITLTSLFQVAGYFYDHASGLFLIAEPTVKNARLSAHRPAKDIPLRDFFPDFIANASMPTPLPADADSGMASIFKRFGFSAANVYDAIHTAMRDLMNVPEATRNLERFSLLAFYRYIVTTTVPYSPSSQNKVRDWWPIAGAAFLESFIVHSYRPELISTAFGHVRTQMEDLMREHIYGRHVPIPGSRRTEIVRTWSFADMIETPAVLPPLREFLATNPEIEYRKLVSLYKTRQEIESLIQFVFHLEAARTYHSTTDASESDKEEGSSSKGKKTNLEAAVIKPTAYLEFDTFHALHALGLVCNFFHC